MSLRVVTMSELRLEVLLEPERTGQSVAEVRRRRGISRETFYEYKRRYELEGATALEPLSRRPTRSPAQIGVDSGTGDLPHAKGPSTVGSEADPGRASTLRCRSASVWDAETLSLR